MGKTAEMTTPTPIITHSEAEGGVALTEQGSGQREDRGSCGHPCACGEGEEEEEGRGRGSDGPCVSGGESEMATETVSRTASASSYHTQEQLSTESHMEWSGGGSVVYIYLSRDLTGGLGE